MPPKRRVVELSACMNGSNSRARVASLIPMPLSVTVIFTERLPSASNRLSSADADEAAVGELDGVADQIEQDLAHPHRIAGDPVGAVCRGIGEQRQTVSAGLRQHRLDRARDQLVYAERERLDSIRPASIFEKSRTSSMMRSRACALSRITATLRACAVSSGERSNTSIIPSTPFIGVRISWLIAARKVDFADWPLPPRPAPPRRCHARAPRPRAPIAALRKVALLDGDYGLIGEGRDEFDFALGERLRPRTPEAHHPDRHAFPQQRHAEHAANSADPRILFGGIVVGRSMRPRSEPFAVPAPRVPPAFLDRAG